MTNENRVAVVTGGGQGIGKGIVEQLCRDGYAVVLADLNETTAKATADELVAKGFKVSL